MSNDDMSEQDKEELYDDVANFNCSSSISIDNLKALFSVAQEILKFKGEQVNKINLVELLGWRPVRKFGHIENIRNSNNF